MDKQAITDYIEQNGGVEIPTLQLKFKLSYLQARQVVNDLVAEKKLAYVSGIWFASTIRKIEYRRPPVTAQSGESIDAENDRSSRMEQFLRELREKRIEEIRRQLDGTLDPDVDDWLTKAITADKDITLKQALKQAQSEFSRAERSVNVNAAAIYKSVELYLSNCDETTFKAIKKRVTGK